jgi:hypothetical protein
MALRNPRTGAHPPAEFARMMMVEIIAATRRPTTNAAMSVLVSRLWRYGSSRGNNHCPSRSIIITGLGFEFKRSSHSILKIPTKSNESVQLAI